MTEHVFDTFTRIATAASRRDYGRALVGLALGGAWSASQPSQDVEAKNRRKNRRKRKRNKNKSDKNRQPASCTATCTGKVCGDDGCGGSCGACGPGQLCAEGQCVTGQGTCQAEHDICRDFNHTCESSTGVACYCWTSESGQTRCGQINPISSEPDCETDSDCDKHDVPGAFCMIDTGDNCERGRFCVAPCPL